MSSTGSAFGAFADAVAGLSGPVDAFDAFADATAGPSGPIDAFVLAPEVFALVRGLGTRFAAALAAGFTAPVETRLGSCNNDKVCSVTQITIYNSLML